MLPSVGRIVHYVSYGTPGGEYTSQCRAAVVSEVQRQETANSPVPDGRIVGLVVLNPTGQFFHSLADGGCVQDEPTASTEDLPPHVPAGGTWHWPEKV